MPFFPNFAPLLSEFSFLTIIKIHEMLTDGLPRKQGSLPNIN